MDIAVHIWHGRTHNQGDAMKHTPGPWTYNKRLADNYTKETEMYGKSKLLQEPVCIIPHDDITVDSYKEVKANARLIAAAPEMLEVLHGIISYNDSLKVDYKLSPALIDHVQRTIAKAEGKG